MRSLVLALGFVFAACAPSAPARYQKRADGSFAFRCGPELVGCVHEASELCKGRGFVVLGGESRRTLYGAEQGESQVEVGSGSLEVRCAARDRSLPEVATPPSAFSSSNAAAGAEPAPAQNPAPPAASTPARACVPGATQRCFGAAACAGGQACLPDGSGFGACDCGSTSAGAAGAAP